MEPAPTKAPIAMSDLDKIDIRVGTILDVDDVPGAALRAGSRLGMAQCDATVR